MKRKLLAVLFLAAALIKIVQIILELNPKTVTVAAWNAQTFFDATFEGTEYEEYGSRSGWSNEDYMVRLLRLAETLKYIDADVVALEEIENIEVVHAIANALPYTSRLRHAVFAKQRNNAFGVALFSKYPITDVCSHQVQLLGENSSSLRPVLEVHLKVPGQNVAFLVNHWKSKVSSADEGRSIRKNQEIILADSIRHIKSESFEKLPVIISLGDFNQKTDEFDIDEKNEKILLHGTESVEEVSSFWFSLKDKNCGSYFFNENWEQIDHIFISAEKAHLGNCSVVKNKDLCRFDGTPNAYKVYSGSGFSDHLPIKAAVRFLD